MTLGINVTENDPEINGNNEPSGRLNLNGQKKPQYLIDAEHEEIKSWHDCMFAIDRHEVLNTKESRIAKNNAEHLYNQAWEHLKEMQIKHNQECAIGVQEPPDDARVFNKRQPDGTYKPIADFFNGVR